MELISGMQGWFSILKLIDIIHQNKLKKKNHMLMLIDTEKAFAKLQHLFVLKKKKTLRKIRMEGKFLK